MQIKTKKTLPVKFLYPVNETSRLNGLLKQIHHGDIEVTANYNPDGSIDIDTITWNGCDIYSLLAYIPEGAELIITLKAAAVSHVEDMAPFDLWQLDNLGDAVQSCHKFFYDRHECYKKWMARQSKLQLLKSAS